MTIARARSYRALGLRKAAFKALARTGLHCAIYDRERSQFMIVSGHRAWS